MTPFLSWLFIGAVFLILLAVWLVIDQIGTYAKSKVFQAPAGPSSGNTARTPRGETAETGLPATGENRRPISFQARAAKGFQKGRSA